MNRLFTAGYTVLPIALALASMALLYKSILIFVESYQEYNKMKKKKANPLTSARRAKRV